MVDKRFPLNCPRHGEYHGDSPNSPCPSGEEGESCIPFLVPAEVHSDDRVIEVEFDAAPYLDQASDEAIRALIACGWGGDYPADEVAEHFQGESEEIDALFTHIHNIRGLRSHKDLCGFECHLDEDAAESWVRKCRPHLVEFLPER